MPPMNADFRTRMVGASLSLIAVLAFGTVGYYLLGDGRWQVVDCLYMTVITLTTVGYGEVLEGFNTVDYVRPFTVLLIVMGMGVVLYFASTFTAFIIEGDLRRALKSTRMRQRISRLKNHFIVCGVGTTGRHVIKEMLLTRTPMVAIDRDAQNLEELQREFRDYGDGFLYVAGDATDDHVLEAAGIAKASGLVAALANDKDNLYLVVTAQQLHPAPDEFRIVARGSELTVLEKLKRAGANSVVSPNFIGGMRLASEMIRPAVVQFLDDMLDNDETIRLEDVHIRPDSELDGHCMRELDLRNRVNVSVLALKTLDAEHYIYNPKADETMKAGMIMVVMGGNKDIEKLRKMAA